MKYQFFVLGFLLFSFYSLLGQSPEDAEKLLDEVSQTMGAFKSMTFDFDYVLENRQENIKQETNGSVTVSGSRYKLLFLGMEQLFDGLKTYTIVPENEEITISSKEETEEIGINPIKLLSFYKEGYAFEWDIKQNVKGRMIQFIKLTPTTTSSEVDYLLLGVDLTKKTIYRLIEIGNNQTRTTLTLSNFLSNVPLASNFFSFDASKYPDYYINQ